MPTVTNSDQQTRVEARLQRIADFLRRQDHLAYVLVVWRDGRQTVFHALPDPETALGIVREAARAKTADLGTPTRHTRPVPRRFTPLHRQIQVCIGGLQDAGVEFLLCYRIDALAPRLTFKVHPSGSMES